MFETYFYYHEENWIATTDDYLVFMTVCLFVVSEITQILMVGSSCKKKEIRRLVRVQLRSHEVLSDLGQRLDIKKSGFSDLVIITCLGGGMHTSSSRYI